MKLIWKSLALIICIISIGCALAKSEQGIELMKADGLTSFRAPTGDWMAVGNTSKDPKNERKLASEPGAGVIMNGVKGRTSNILTQMEHGDIEAHIEFMVPKGSNSGVYFQGRYEIQVFDSWGAKKPKHNDCGGIYQRWNRKGGYEGRPPRANASLEPGKWQTFDIIFRAPRFDESGKKIKNAVFEKVVHNGVVVHEDQELTGPTRASTYNDEKALGPMMLQGDHGPVSYRNISIRPLSK